MEMFKGILLVVFCALLATACIVGGVVVVAWAFAYIDIWKDGVVLACK